MNAASFAKHNGSCTWAAEPQHVKPTDRSVLGHSARVMTALVAAGTFAAAAWADGDPVRQMQAPERDAAVASDSRARTGHVSPFRQQQVTAKAKQVYLTAWGIDRLKASSTSSGNLIRFSYRVVDPERAKPLGDKAATPYLYAQRSRAVLHVPVMDKVGMLRQAGTPQSGQEYWMVFSNKGNLVRPGDRVNVMIGAFHADGLVVE